MKTKFLFLLIIIAVTLSSCSYNHCTHVSQTIQHNFTFCYDGKNTGIDSLININGYFTVKKIDTEHPYYIRMALFEDGTFTYNFGVPNYKQFADDDNSSRVRFYFKEIAQNKEGKDNFTFKGGYYWGGYSVIGDTIIKVQYVSHPSPNAPLFASAWEVLYKIIDKNTIAEIDENPIYKMSELDREQLRIHKKEHQHEYLTLKFIPVEVMPEPDCWLKKQDWFWCKNRK